MGLFGKKTEIYCSKGKNAEWKMVEKKLEEAGIHTYDSVYSEDVRSVPPCCALPEDKIHGGPDRNVYQIRVLQNDKERAEAIVREAVPKYVPYVGRRF